MISIQLPKEYVNFGVEKGSHLGFCADLLSINTEVLVWCAENIGPIKAHVLVEELDRDNDSIIQNTRSSNVTEELNRLNDPYARFFSRWKQISDESDASFLSASQLAFSIVYERVTVKLEFESDSDQIHFKLRWC